MPVNPSHPRIPAQSGNLETQMTQAKPSKADLTTSLEVARRDLLDLGLRNPLLNYRVLRSRGLDIIDEKPAEIFRILVREEKRMTFLPGEPRRVNGNDDEPQLAQPEDEVEASTRHSDLHLQTTYTSVQLQGRLLATYRAARISIEEQGVNTLYLALGMLSWREDDKSDKFYRAPLILIPVELERSDARDRFHLKYNGEDLGENVSLLEKLKQGFGFKKFPELAESDDLDVTDYFQAVGRAILGRPGWIVETGAIALGFFSFAKFLMYRDLDSATWPNAQGILDHEILQALLGDGGFQSSASNYQDDGLLDDQIRDRQIMQVVDADSSQTIALLDALDGRSMVIQGPPGTGKSQTIVNLIAGAVADGKKVLFVAEKMAALDVVKRRLDKVGLGGACLELHNNRTNKKTIVEELKRTAYAERSAVPGFGTELALLSDSRDRLNAYCKAVNEPIGDSGETPCSAYGKLLTAQGALHGLETPALRVDGAEKWTSVEAARRAQLVEQLQGRVARSGVPSRHAFWGSRLTIVLPTDRDQIRELALRAGAAGARIESSSRTLAQTCAVQPPSNPTEAAFLFESARHTTSAPELIGIDTELPEWLSQEGEVRQIIEAGKQHRDLRCQYDRILRPEAWTGRVSDVRQVVANWGGRWWRLLSGRWREARQNLASLCFGPAPSDQASQLSLLDAITVAQESSAKVLAAQNKMAPLFQSGWRGLDSDWDFLERQAHWIITTQRGIQQGLLASWCLGRGLALIDRIQARRTVQEFEAAWNPYLEAVKLWTERLEIDESRFVEGALASQSFSALISRWEAHSAHIDDLHSLVAVNQIAAECEKEGLPTVVAITWGWESAGSALLSLYELARLSTLLDRAFRERPPLASFDGGSHARTVSQFQRLDLLQLEFNRVLISARHAQSLPAGGGSGEIGVLWREFERQRGFLPIRTLMLKAGHAIQSIKPVFMMSPLSIANYLPPGSLNFDVVIFDEASQVKPVDALGAITRGKQVVVVGDSQQLPPTSFFDSFVSSDESEEEEEVATSDIESILGLFCARAAHQRMLRWHYRSRHESLITVSNHLFYDDRLVVFPSPTRERKNLGLVYRRLENAWYDRGRTRTNPQEAKIVAAAVMEHARRQLQLPREQRETLGVGAFSMAQMDAVQKQVELLRRQNPSCEEFFSYPPHEPFFVKNLENLQGDERDVIFISIGYGRTPEGFLTMSFGPLTQNGGERRLNVLISRARKRCEVFTSLTAGDIDTSRTPSLGLAALKTFLSYAQTGQIEVAHQTGRAPDSDFEEQVLRQLKQLGYDVHTQVGCTGFFLDLAVVDPAHPGRYLLGIECDGARYHSAHSARDRDRLRQAVLEDLGWRIHRIWSTDWFHNPSQELRKVVLAIETAKTAGPEPQSEPAVANIWRAKADASQQQPASSQTPPAQAHEPSRSVSEYECVQLRVHLGDVDMHLVDRNKLANLLAEVVKVESPVHWLEAARRVLSGAGVQRFGSRIRDAFEQAAQMGVSSKLFERRGDFLWSLNMQQPPVRDRSVLAAASRKLDLVAPEEIRRAILIVVQESYGIVPEEVPNAVCRLFGFARVTDELRTSVEPHRDALLREGHLALNGLNLVLVPPQPIDRPTLVPCGRDLK
jgi:very-short-patch-repair endonuclease